MVLVLFSISVFLSAALLFLVEPMVAKMLLPLLGGSPAVWNSCLVFFQAVLLAGYAYAHAAKKWFRWRVMLGIQCAMVLFPAAIGVLPLHLPHGWMPPTQTNPIPWIMSALAVSVGIPFFALSSCTPMLQRWFAASTHPHAKDPYFLYAASNAGSLIGLLAYPLLIEPTLSITVQSRLWSFGYAVLVAFTLSCAVMCWNRPSWAERPEAQNSQAVTHAIRRGTWLRWIALAFVPSSLMLGVTTAITADVPAIPLFWVVPLALYLLSFVLVFARRQIVTPAVFNRRLPILILCGLVPGMLQSKLPLPVLLILYSALLFSVAMVCHGELAASRPPVSKLTAFYLFISIGGVLGGIFNSIVAPIAFHSVLEFPIALICAALLRPSPDLKSLDGFAARRARLDWLLPLGLGACMAFALVIPRAAKINLGTPSYILIFGIAMVCCLSFAQRPLRFGLGTAATFLASAFYVGPYGHVLVTERSFFGVYRVANDQSGKFRNLLHGGTVHGMQSLDPAKSRTPLAYYTLGGPAGQITRAVQGQASGNDWALVGLGAGAMACLAQPGQNLTYFEIDPLVARIAEDPRDFTFLKQCAPLAGIVLGDARPKLREARDGQYRLIVLDAFSGDSIPMHLITREALQLYLRKLATNGLIAFHITNQHLDLAPVLGNLAQDAKLVAWIEDDSTLTEQQASDGKLGSRWVVMARNKGDLAHLVTSADSFASWVALEGRANARVWTDDYSNLLTVIRWR